MTSKDVSGRTGPAPHVPEPAPVVPATPATPDTPASVVRPSRPSRPTRRGRRLRLLVAVLAGLLLFGPWLAALAGSRSDPVPGENRALSGLPAFGGFSTFERLTAWAADRMPLRDAAIRANGDVSQALFGERPSYGGGSNAAGAPGAAPTQAPAEGAQQPADQVIEGREGWLYFFDDFRRACRPEVPLAEVLDGVRRMDRTLQASGRRLVLAVPPDKSTVDPEFLPDRYVDDECSVPAKDERWKQLDALDTGGWVDLRGPLQEQKTRTGLPAYLPTDTHWTDLSASLFAQRLAAELDPALATGTTVLPDGTRSYPTGDLSAIAQNPKAFTEPGYRVQRDGVTSRTTPEVLRKGYELSRVRSTTTGAPLFTPRTVLVGDSFSQRSLPKLAPYFADLLRVPELTKAIAAGYLPGAEQRLLQEIVASDVVVVELVERTFAGAKAGSPFTPAFQDRLAQALAAAPQR